MHRMRLHNTQVGGVGRVVEAGHEVQRWALRPHHPITRTGLLGRLRGVEVAGWVVTAEVRDLVDRESGVFDEGAGLVLR